MLVCADGATSRLATKLGYCTEPAKGVCSRAFVEGGTHNVNYDGVCFYPRWSLPGYAAIFRHPNDELNYCYYLIPCGKDGMCGDVKVRQCSAWTAGNLPCWPMLPAGHSCADGYLACLVRLSPIAVACNAPPALLAHRVPAAPCPPQESDLPRLHNEAMKRDPFISQSLGPDFKIERMRAASLRLGGQGLTTTYDDHMLIIGDAAGHIDPLTGASPPRHASRAHYEHNVFVCMAVAMLPDYQRCSGRPSCALVAAVACMLQSACI